MFTPKQISSLFGSVHLYECDSCAALVAAESMETHKVWHDKNDTQQTDTSSPESVKYHIAFHKSQQEKKRKKTS